MAWEPLVPQPEVAERGVRRDEAAEFCDLPLAGLVLDAGASAVVVNDAWTDLTGLTRKRSAGARWLRAVSPGEREVLLARLRRAAAGGEAGTVDCRLSGRQGGRWSRWWWKPGGPGLVVCVADIDLDKAWESHLWQRATHDPLTGLVNRSEFLDLVQRAVRRRARTGSPAAVVFVDLDGFKAVNDRGGHAMGDDVLRSVAARVVPAIRPADVAARIGGDEFAVLCEDLHEPGEAEWVAERLRGAVHQTVVVEGRPHTVSATTGVAVTEGDHDSAEDLLARADAAMYSAKRAKGCRCDEPWPRVSIGPKPTAAGRPADPGPVAGGPDPAAAGGGHLLDLVEADEEDVASLVNQVFAVGLTLESVASLSTGPAAERLRHAIDDLDLIGREIRAGLGPPPEAAGRGRPERPGWRPRAEVPGRGLAEPEVAGPDPARSLPGRVALDR